MTYRKALLLHRDLLCRCKKTAPRLHQHHVRSVSSSRPWGKISHKERDWWRERMSKMLEGNHEDLLTIAIDCAPNTHHSMNEREHISLARQICFSYGATLRSEYPCRLHLVGLEPGGNVETALRRDFTGFDSDSALLKRCSQPLCEVFDKKNMVYLSPYSTTALDKVDGSKVYVLGGMIDGTRIKNLTECVAGDMGIPTACLPIKQFLRPLGNTSGTLDLTLDQVVKMLVSVHRDGDWLKAFARYFPKRKQWATL